MTYDEFIRKIRYILNTTISTDDADLKKALYKVIEKEIKDVCNSYYNE